MSLTQKQVDQYRTTGWLAPIDVLGGAEVADLLARFEQAEREFPHDLHAENRNNAHLQFNFLADVVRHELIVEAARSLIGDDIVLWSTVLFVKEPDSSAFVSWHQDAMYMGLEPDNFVTAWLAFTPSNPDTGCVAVVDGSHRNGPAQHEDLYEPNNILTRGQTVSGVDSFATSNLVLDAGQMSLHHPWLVHGSLPNRSDQRRIGLAMQGYMGGDVAPTRGEHHVMHISGAPAREDFTTAPAPAGDFQADTASRNAANKALADVLYHGAKERRKL